MPIKIHSQFKLNGASFSNTGLLEMGRSLAKEGKPFEQGIGDFLLAWSSDKPTITVQTSGATGTPKPIVLRKEFMVNSAIATGGFFNLMAGDTALLCLSIDYIAAKMMLVRAMVLGLELDYIQASSSPLDGNFKTYDFCAMVPLQVENSVEQIHCIKKLIVGGAPMSKTLKKKLQEVSTQVFETYGMTETITHIAAKKITGITTKASRTVFDVDGVHCFKTLPGVTVSIDKRSCLRIKAPSIAIETVVTNDVVRLISETEFEWLGRYDNLINSGGIKLIPEQIEAKLATVIEACFFVTGKPDEKLGEKLVLIIEGKMNEDQLLEKIKKLKILGKFEVPREVISVSEFKKTKNGKIRRKRTLDYIS